MAVSQPEVRRTDAVSQDILLAYGVASQPGARRSAGTGRLEARQDRRYLGSLAVLVESVGDDQAATNAGDRVGQLVRSYFARRLDDPLANLLQTVSAVNASSYAEAVRTGHVGRHGAKVLAVAIVGQRAHIVSIGDLRAYLVRQGRATPITRPIIQMGQAGRSAMFLGQSASLPLSPTSAADGRFSFQLELSPGDAIVLCSDDLAHALGSAEIAQLAAGAPAPQAARQLVERAERLGADQTAVVIQYVASPPRFAGIVLPRVGVLAAVLLLALLLAGAGLVWLRGPERGSEVGRPTPAEMAERSGGELPVRVAGAETPTASPSAAIAVAQQTQEPRPAPTGVPSPTNPPPTLIPTPTASAPATATPTETPPTATLTETPSTETPSTATPTELSPTETPTELPPTATSAASGGPRKSNEGSADTSVVERGSPIRFTAYGFLAGERLTAWAWPPGGGQEVVSHLVIADGDGTARWEWKVPPYAEPGPWIMSVGSARLEISIPFEVVRASSAAGPSQANEEPSTPSEGPRKSEEGFADKRVVERGSSIRFTAYGFLAGERLTAWAWAPGGVSVRVSELVIADGDGTATWEWEVPSYAEPGHWIMSVGSARLEVSIPFEVVPKSQS